MCSLMYASNILNIQGLGSAGQGFAPCIIKTSFTDVHFFQSSFVGMKLRTPNFLQRGTSTTMGTKVIAGSAVFYSV